MLEWEGLANKTSVRKQKMEEQRREQRLVTKEDMRKQKEEKGGRGKKN